MPPGHERSNVTGHRVAWLILLVIILLTASAFSAFTGDAASFFIISTMVIIRNPFKSRPNPWLIVCSLTVVAVAVLLPLTPAGVYLGFIAPPAFFFLILTSCC